jgi:hypothetical protein
MIEQHKFFKLVFLLTQSSTFIVWAAQHVQAPVSVAFLSCQSLKASSFANQLSSPSRLLYNQPPLPPSPHHTLSSKVPSYVSTPRQKHNRTAPSAQLVEQANAFAVSSLGWGLSGGEEDGPKTLGMMGLKGVPGLNI